MARLANTLVGLALVSGAVAAPQAAPSTAAASSGVAAAPGAQPSGYSGKSVYVMSNDPNMNAVFSLPIASDGTLTFSGNTSTGGQGGAVITSGANINTGAGIDTLASQGALQVLGTNLFAVNAGSNTLSMFAINPNNPQQLSLVGQPISTLGDFPNSVAVSNANPNLVCVSNTGTRSGIACFKVTSNGLKQTDGQLHKLPLSPAQSNPPTGPANTVSQPFFSADGTSLYVTVKGYNMTSPGYFGSFPVSSSGITGSLTQSQPANTGLLFGSIALSNNQVFTTDPEFGAVLLQVSSTGVAKTVKTFNIANQGATCWTVVSPATGLGYTADDGANQIAAFNLQTQTNLGTMVLPNNNGANIQIKASGSLLYALSHGDATHKPRVAVLQTNGSGGGGAAASKFRVAQGNYCRRWPRRLSCRLCHMRCRVKGSLQL